MEERQPIDITIGTKGIVVRAIPNEKNNEIYKCEWVLLVSHVKTDGADKLLLYRHASINNKGWHLTGPSKKPILWGRVDYYDFYLATEEEKKQIKEQLLSNGLKYVKAINKVIDR